MASHTVILVSSYELDTLRELHAVAESIFQPPILDDNPNLPQYVSPVTSVYEVDDGYSHFAVFSDRMKERPEPNWQRIARHKLIKALHDSNVLGHRDVEWAVIKYGADNEWRAQVMLESGLPDHHSSREPGYAYDEPLTDEWEQTLTERINEEGARIQTLLEQEERDSVGRDTV
jgi:hypothetical protein